MKLTKFLLIFCMFVSFLSNAQVAKNLTYNDNVPGLNTNPNRGLIPGFGVENDFPYSTEFFYIPLKGTMTGMNSFDWTLFESELEKIANRGNTAIPRFYLDYPTRPIATPDFLAKDITMKNYRQNGNDPNNPNHSKSPDYNNQKTIDALKNFIIEYGKKYDGDPRISVVQAGLVGFWGEWHNYCDSGNCDSGLEMTNENKKTILTQFTESFTKTQVNVRLPKDGTPFSILSKVGYHDDSFAFTTISPTTNWFFLPTLKSFNVQNVWKEHPIGGEIFPDMQPEIWSTIPNPKTFISNNKTENSEDFQKCVEQTHSTYMLNQGVFKKDLNQTKRNNALSQNKLLGYQFYVKQVTLREYQSGTINFDVQIENRGIAPFYYNWEVEVALLNNGNVESLGRTRWDINKIMPKSIPTDVQPSVSKNFTINKQLQNGSSYTILMRFVNPLENTTFNNRQFVYPQAKKLVFANSEQDKDSKGWLSLTNFQIGTAPTSSFSGNNKILSRSTLESPGNVGTSGKGLDVIEVNNSSYSSGTGIQLYEYSFGDNQRWKFELADNGNYFIKSKRSGMCLAPSNLGLSDGESVKQKTCGLGNEFKWKVIPTDQGFYKILNANSEKGLDVTGKSTLNGALIQVYTYFGSPNQQWKIVNIDATGRVGNSLEVENTEPNENEISLSPNPVSNLLKIKSKYLPNGTIEILSISGKLAIKQANLTESDEKTIDVSSIQQGVYLLKVSNKDGFSVKKVVKE